MQRLNDADTRDALGGRASRAFTRVPTLPCRRVPPSQAESWAASLAERASAAPDATSPAPAEEDLLLQGSRPEAESATIAVTAVARQRRTPAPGRRRCLRHFRV